MATTAPAPGRRLPAGLRRQLDTAQTVAVSVGVMAPTLAMSITGVAAAAEIGRAAPLAYVVAALGVGLVAYGFVRLSSTVAHAGSVYAFVGAALGPRAGFVAGWALLGTYLVFPAVSISAAAVFGRALLDSAGIAHAAAWFPLALLAWGVIWFLASRQIRTASRSLLAIEVASMLLILVLMILVVIALIDGSAPRGQDVDLHVFDLPPGTGLSALALASTFGFLSFAGFEAAGSLGEEARAPRRAIPRSIVTAIAVGGVFYVACVAVQSMGFGADAAGVSAFVASGAPLGDLATAYVGSGMASALDAAAIVSAIGAGLGCASVSARMLFALARDGRVDTRLAGVSAATGAPARGLAFVMVFDILLLAVFAAFGAEPMDVFFYLATIGTLSLLTMYVITNVAAVRFLAGEGARAEPALPIAGIGVAGYVLYHHIWPVPDSPYDLFPYLVAVWLAIGVVLARVRVTRE